MASGLIKKYVSKYADENITSEQSGNVLFFPENRTIISARFVINGSYRPVFVSPINNSKDGAYHYVGDSTNALTPIANNTQYRVVYKYFD